MNIARLCILLCAVALVACDPAPLEEDGSLGPWPNPEGAAKQLSSDAYNSLSPEQQYQVANKLAGTLYKGVPASEFFDLTAGTKNLKVSGGKGFVAGLAQKLTQRLVDKSPYMSRVNSRYGYVERRRATAEPLAVMWELPISRDLFENWMAYTLANTILFSPAEEIDSADYVDVQHVYNGLVSAMASDTPIRDIVFAHMKSQANWRRFRSPEDNTREMIEIYLGLFDRDADVPKAAIACKNWYLTDDTDGYQLIVKELDANIEPQKVLDQWVTTCEDFYRVVAGHPLLIPRITSVLVDHFFPKYSAEKRAALVQSIVATNPVYFSDIFAAIIFSDEYLLNDERPKSFEEAFFNIAGRTYWTPYRNFFSDLTNPDSGVDRTLKNMQQPAMSLKLGRWKDQPLDSLSFAHFHKALRERLLIDRKVNAFSQGDGGWDAALINTADFLEQNDFIDYLMLSVTGRRATQEELATLNEVITARGFDEDRAAQADIVLDYISRLPEIYFQNAQQ